MALIKCNECGASVSEKSEMCMKCGNPMTEILREIQAVKKKKHKKLIISGIAIFLFFLLISIGVTIFFKIRALKNPFYVEMDWGSSYESVLEELKGRYPDDAIEDKKDKRNITVMETDYLGVKGVTSSISYKFTEDKFSRVIIVITIDKEAEVQNSDLIKQYESILTRMYGSKDKDPKRAATSSWTKENLTVKVTAFMEGLISIDFKSENQTFDL